MSHRPRRLVVAAALVDNLAAPARLLSARRTEPPAWAGFWEFPGGKVEPGETPEQGLHRELAEELGITVQLGEELLDEACINDPDHGLVWPLSNGMVFRLWAAQVTGHLVEGAPVALQEHDQLRWLDAEELLDVEWLPSDAAAVARCDRLLRHNEST